VSLVLHDLQADLASGILGLVSDGKVCLYSRTCAIGTRPALRAN
jgi:hypothetical protein